MVKRNVIPAPRLLVIGLAVVIAGCGKPPAPSVSPADIPALEQRVRARPDDADLRFRLAAAYLAAGRCPDAHRAVDAGQHLDPDNVLAPLVRGGCQERAGHYDLAVATYRDFVALYPDARGLVTLHAKLQEALRLGAELAARQALERESELTATPPEPRTLAVLPVTVAGDSSFHALSRGLAELIVTDLAAIRSFRLLERLHVGALLDELELARAGQLDPTTAARVGRLLRAERMIQGVAHIPSEHGEVRLQASVVAGDGTVLPGAAVGGAFRDLLRLEKELVLELGAQLGVELTAAERQRILDEGPKDLAAFLAYSQGLEALDGGDFGAAAGHFGDAVRRDPAFRAAADARDAAEAIPVVRGAEQEGGVVAVAAAAGGAQAGEAAPGDAVGEAARDVAPTLSDVLRQGTKGTGESGRATTPEARGLANLQGTSSTIRIIFRRPQ